MTADDATTLLAYALGIGLALGLFVAIVLGSISN